MYIAFYYMFTTCNTFVQSLSITETVPRLGVLCSLCLPFGGSLLKGPSWTRISLVLVWLKPGLQLVSAPPKPTSLRSPLERIAWA